VRNFDTQLTGISDLFTQIGIAFEHAQPLSIVRDRYGCANDGDG